MANSNDADPSIEAGRPSDLVKKTDDGERSPVAQGKPGGPVDDENPPVPQGWREIQIQEHFSSGPFPSPEILWQYSQIYPDAPKIIFQDFQKETAHRQKIEELTVRSQIDLARKGQFIGGMIGMTGILGSIVVTGMGQGMWGSVIAGTTLISLVSTFVIGRAKKSGASQPGSEVEPTEPGGLMGELERDRD